MKWTIARARQSFSKVIRSAARSPQAIYHRRKLVAGVVDGATLSEILETKERKGQKTIGAAFEELRAICQEEEYELVVSERRDRDSEFLPRAAE